MLKQQQQQQFDKWHTVRIVADCLVWAVMGCLLIWSLSGFAHAKEKANSIIPLNCLHEVHISDFTKPCRVDSKNPNMARCDGVIIRFACVKYNGLSQTP